MVSGETEEGIVHSLDKSVLLGKELTNVWIDSFLDDKMEDGIPRPK